MKKRKLVELPIYLYDKKLADLGVSADTVAKMSIDLDLIFAYGEAAYEQSEELTNTCIYIEGGETFIIGMKYSEFKKLMEESSSIKVNA